MSAAGPILIKKRNGKVMIVSPSQELREKVSSSLGPESQPVTEAAGGAEALLKLRESDFCTLMLDPNIEDLHTEELVATIRARYPGLNIVVLEDEKRSRQFSDERTTAVGADSNPPDGPIAALRGAPPVSSRLRAAGPWVVGRPGTATVAVTGAEGRPEARIRQPRTTMASALGERPASGLTLGMIA